MFGVGYAELGLVASLMYVASGLMQTPAGILVDRLGPSRVLIGGVGLFSASVLLSGLVPGFWWLAPLAILAGLGNAVFHPADYAIMTARVDPRRLGRAFGAHGVAGNLGWVAAPASVLGLTALFGWRAALVILGGVGLALHALPDVATRGPERRDQDRPAGARRQSRGRGRSRTARAAGAVGAAVLRLFHVAVGRPGRIADILPVGGGGGVRRVDRRGERDVDRFSGRGGARRAGWRHCRRPVSAA